MLCSRCNTENDSHQKFCKSCGAPMGIVCDRCGSVNPREDGYCGACGQALVSSLKQDEPSFAPPEKARLGSTRQYTPQEIEELLLLRRAMKAEEQSLKIMSQDEIDRLYR